MIVKERLAVEEYGGSIYFTDEMTSSSSKLINKYFSNYNQNTKQWLDKFRATDGFALTCKYLDLISNLRILVLGETILDQYTYCTPLGKSSKDPILAFRTHDTHVFPGGVLAIANNCAQWAKHVTVNTFIGSNSGSSKFDISMLDKKISTSAITLDSRPTILKHRYVDKISGSRIFEYYDFEPHDLNEDEQSRIISSLRCDLTDVDIVIAADYGHGYFSTEVVNEIVTTQNYLAVNTQANAGNRGYNTISKYPRANLISINSGELQLELRNRNPEIEKFVPALVSDMSAEIAIVTLGAGGIQLFNSSGQTEKVPALAEKIVDKVGAGDAVLAISSLLAKVTAPLAVIGFVANLVAAHEVSQLGHQTSLALSDIKKHAKAILG
jgi:rfaE bifunctional protein kinase chain/domain